MAHLAAASVKRLRLAAPAALSSVLASVLQRPLAPGKQRIVSAALGCAASGHNTPMLTARAAEGELGGASEAATQPRAAARHRSDPAAAMLQRLAVLAACASGRGPAPPRVLGRSPASSQPDADGGRSA